MFSNQTVIANGGLKPRHGRKTHTSGADFLSALVRGMRHHYRCQRDYRYLQELPDYLLDDIGLTRSEVKATTRLPF